MQIKYLQSQYNRKVWCSPSKIGPLLLVLVMRKAEYDVLDIKNYIPKSLSDREEKACNYSPLTSNPVIVTMSRSVGIMVTKGKMNPFMEVAQNPKKVNIRAILIGMSCQESMMGS